MNKKILGITINVWYHVLAVIISAFIVAPITFMILDRDDPIEIFSQRLEGDLIPGGNVSLIWEIKAKRVCNGIAQQKIISSDGIIHEYDERPTVIRSHNGERGTYSISFDLPRNISFGTARLEINVRYYCNPLQYWLAWPNWFTLIYFI